MGTVVDTASELVSGNVSYGTLVSGVFGFYMFWFFVDGYNLVCHW